VNAPCRQVKPHARPVKQISLLLSGLVFRLTVRQNPACGFSGGRRTILRLRSGSSAERRHLKKSGKVCGGLPTRRYKAGESSAVILKIRSTEFAGRLAAKTNRPAEICLTGRARGLTW